MGAGRVQDGLWESGNSFKMLIQGLIRTDALQYGSIVKKDNRGKLLHYSTLVREAQAILKHSRKQSGLWCDIDSNINCIAKRFIVRTESLPRVPVSSRGCGRGEDDANCSLSPGAGRI